MSAKPLTKEQYKKLVLEAVSIYLDKDGSDSTINTTSGVVAVGNSAQGITHFEQLDDQVLTLTIIVPPKTREPSSGYFRMNR